MRGQKCDHDAHANNSGMSSRSDACTRDRMLTPAAYRLDHCTCKSPDCGSVADVMSAVSVSGMLGSKQGMYAPLERNAVPSLLHSTIHACSVPSVCSANQAASDIYARKPFEVCPQDPWMPDIGLIRCSARCGYGVSMHAHEPVFLSCLHPCSRVGMNADCRRAWEAMGRICRFVPCLQPVHKWALCLRAMRCILHTGCGSMDLPDRAACCTVRAVLYGKSQHDNLL